MIRLALPAALFCAALAHGAVADVNVTPPRMIIGCSPPLWGAGIENVRIRAQETLPIFLRNAFDENGVALDTVTLIVEIPTRYSPDCPPSSEPVRGIETLDNGMLRGQVVHNSLSWNSEIHGKTIEFRPDMVIDWSYRAPGSGNHRQFGDYTRRDTAVGDDMMMRMLAPHPVPHDWD